MQLDNTMTKNTVTFTVPFVTVGIPTYEAGESLVVALDSIYAQSSFSSIKEVLVVTDGKKLTSSMKQQLERKKLKIVEKSTRKGQSRRINDIFELASTQLLVLTNDDVIWDKHALRELVSQYKQYQPDLLSAKAVPLEGPHVLEKLLAVGYALNHTVLSYLKKDSYLSCNGRLIVLSKKLYKQAHIPEKLWNNDAYLFLFAKLNNFSYRSVSEAVVYFRSPSTLRDHLRQSVKFQVSQVENQSFFSKDVTDFYTVSKSVMLKSLAKVMVQRPVATIGYIGLLLYSRLMSRPALHTTGTWETDYSTKLVKQD